MKKSFTLFINSIKHLVSCVLCLLSKKLSRVLFLVSCVFCLTSLTTYSQIGGNSTYQFLDLTNSARIQGIGGDFLPVKDNDISLALSNPSIISKELDNNMALNFINYFSDVKIGNISYSKTFNTLGSFCANVQYANYGTFTETDPTGQNIGNFTANEEAVSIGWGRQLDSLFSIGANIKSIFSNLYTYRSFGLAVDVAGTYVSPDKFFTATLIAKNIGRQITTYTDGVIEPLPLEMQVGISKTFEHVPLKFIILYNHIEQFNLSYNDPNNPDVTTDPITGLVTEKSNISKGLDKLMRHFVFGLEFIPLQYFNLQFGYNYQRRQELGLISKMSLTGFSGGIGVKISKFKINYSLSKYSLAGSPNTITISTNISSFYTKK